MIFLYDQSETSFVSMGRGPIADALSCRVSYSDSGAYELELEYPVNGPLHNYLVNRAIIYAKPNRVRNFQPFRIDEISRPSNGKIKYYAKHISYDLSGIPISAYKIDKTTDGTAMTKAIDGISTHAIVQSVSPFTFSTTKNTQKYRNDEFKLEAPASVREVMDSIKDTYKYGVWDFDMYNCVLYSTGEDNTDTGQVMGSDNGVVLYYGRNFIDATQESKFNNVVSGIYPFWKSSSVASQGSVASRLLSGLQGYINGDKSISSIVSDTGLTWAQVKAFAEEYVQNEPHTVDLSSLAGMVTGGDTSVSATDTHTGDGVTTTFTLGIKFKSISKVTIDDKNVGDAKYTYNEGYNTITFTRETPANNSTIKIIGTVPDLVELPEKVYAPSGYSPGYVKILPVNLSSEFEGAPVESDLRSKAAEYWAENHLGTPEVSISLSYNDLKRLPEFSNINCAEGIDLGDMVTVNFVNMGICEKVKVTRIEYDPINDIYTALDLGQPKPTLALTIVQNKKDISNKPTVNEVSQNTSDAIISTETKYALSSSKTDCPQPQIDENGVDSVWQSEAPTPVSGMYLWRKTVTTYASGKVISSGHTCIDNGSSDVATAVATSTKTSQTIYRLATSSDTPAAPTTWIDTASSNPNVWSTIIPTPVAKGHYWYCTQTKLNNGQVVTSEVFLDSANDLLLSWAETNNANKIDGGLVAANTIVGGSIKAGEITANHLSTDAITSRGYQSGIIYSTTGTKLDLSNGSIKAPNFAITSDGTAYFRGKIYSSEGTIGGFDIVETSSASGLEFRDSNNYLFAEITDNKIAIFNPFAISWTTMELEAGGVKFQWMNSFGVVTFDINGIKIVGGNAAIDLPFGSSGGILSGEWHTRESLDDSKPLKKLGSTLYVVNNLGAQHPFRSSAFSLDITNVSFTDAHGDTITYENLSIGDMVCFSDRTVLDRYVSDIAVEDTGGGEETIITFLPIKGISAL